MSTMAANRSVKAGKPMDPLQKRIPENPKYKHVKSTIDTGASLSKYMNKIEEIKQNYKFRKDEIFKRMKVTTYCQLLIQVQRVNADLYDDEMMPETPASFRPDTADLEIQRAGRDSPTPSLALTDGDYGGRGEPESGRSTFLSVSRGVGELDMNQSSDPSTSQSRINTICPYLLLDVRDKDEYDQCHIITALSYPKAILSRAQNYESKEMLAYKNQGGKIIIIYDDDERIAAIAATTLVQRGYDNLFMLSGGLKVALKVFPEGLVTGTPPLSVTGVKPKSIKPASQTSLTNEDVNKLEIYLDNSMQDHSTASRLSKASIASSRMSTISSARSVTSSSSVITDRPAFK